METVPARRPVNILLVDDQPAKLLSYEVILNELGENLLKASSGREALAHLLKTDVAVVLIDVCMPDLDGFEVAQMIREHPRLEQTAIILVSAVYMTDLDRLKGYLSGAVDYVPVPIIPEVLRAKVRVFAELYRKTEELKTVNEELEDRVAHRTMALESTATQLQKSEERFRFMAETVPSMIWIADTYGALTYTNRRWLDYRGLGALDEGRAWPQDELHEEDRDRWFECWRHHLSRGERFEVEARHRGADGQYRWFLTRAVPRRAPSGEILSWFGISTDIEEQKGMQGRLRDADRRKDEFLAVLAHELRNPLSPIRNAVDLMGRHDDLPAELRWCRDVIQRQTTHLVRLVDDLLDVARITSGKVRLQRERVDLCAVLRHAVDACRPQVEAKKLALRVDAPGEPQWLHGDFIRLSQVFGNLISNAAKYTAEGGHIDVRLSRIDVAADGEPQAVVTVRDDGIGIPAAMLSQVFELFTQVPHAVDVAPEGLGIGLGLVRALVQLHGGVVQAASDGPGRGAEFMVRLPLEARAAAAPVQAPSPTTASRANGRGGRDILVVDDNRDSAFTLSALLERLGHRTVRAHDGLEALEVLATYRPDAILLDIGMPRLDGYGAARWVRQQPWGHEVLIIAQTGWGQEADREKAAAAGFDHHLTKPIDVDALLALIDDRSPAIVRQLE